jgi:hypothetical protein
MRAAAAAARRRAIFCCPVSPATAPALPIFNLRPGVGGADDAKDGEFAALALGIAEDEVVPVDD